MLGFWSAAQAIPAVNITARINALQQKMVCFFIAKTFLFEQCQRI